MPPTPVSAPDSTPAGRLTPPLPTAILPLDMACALPPRWLRDSIHPSKGACLVLLFVIRLPLREPPPTCICSGGPMCGASTRSTPSASAGRPSVGRPRACAPRASRPLDRLVLLAYTHLRLARPVVADQRLPWES